MKFPLTLLAALLITGNVFSQSEPKDIIKKFFDIYRLQESNEAIDYLFTNSPYAEEIVEGIDDLKRKVKKQISQIGLYYGFDLIGERKAGPNIIMYTYIVRHARQPIVFSFSFYKPNTKWNLHNFKYTNFSFDDFKEESIP